MKIFHKNIVSRNFRYPMPLNNRVIYRSFSFDFSLSNRAGPNYYIFLFIFIIKYFIWFYYINYNLKFNLWNFFDINDSNKKSIWSIQLKKVHGFIPFIIIFNRATSSAIKVYVVYVVYVCICSIQISKPKNIKIKT